MNNFENHIWDYITYTIIAEKQREKDGFLPETFLVQQISGQLLLETSAEKITTNPGDIFLVRKNQFIKTTKIPLEG